MTPHSALDPQFRALLEELAGDPNARLLRVTPAELHASLYEHERRVFPSAAFLSNVERHLLEGYRDELGRVLYRFGVVLLFSQGKPPLLHYGDHQVPLPNEKDVRASAQHLHGLPAAGEIDPQTAALLKACTQGEAGISPERVFAAVLRVRPSPKALRTLGGAMVASAIDDPVPGIHLIEQALNQDLPGTGASYSWECAAWAASVRGELRESAIAFEKSCFHDTARPLPAQSWLLAALQLGDFEQVLRADRHLSSLPTSVEATVAWHADLLGTTRRLGAWRPSREAIALLPKLDDSVSTTTRKLIHAIA